MSEPESGVKVLLLNHVSAFGGAERGLLDMATLLRETRYRPLVVLPGNGPLRQRLAERAIDVSCAPVVRMRRTRNALRLMRDAFRLGLCARRLAGLMRRQGVAWVHSNSSTAHLYGGLAARLAGVPAVWHCRDMPTSRRLARRMAALATRTVAVSAAVAEALARVGAGAAGGAQRNGPHPLDVIYNAVDTDEFRERGLRTAARREFDFDVRHFVVGMVAHMSPWKGHVLFLEMARQAARSRAAMGFLLGGADLFGEQARYVRRLQDLAQAYGLTDRVRFAGFRDDMPAMYEAMDLLVHPALNEPFGRAVVEAMAMGRPVVALDSGGPREIVRHEVNGLLAEPDPAALARSVLRLAADAERRHQLARAARVDVHRRFGLERYRQDLLALYGSL